MKLLTDISRIQDLLDGWRTLGSRHLDNGVELIGRMPVDDEELWMHAIFPRLDSALVDELENQVRASFPRSMRAFYLACGGMDLFSGAFHLFGYRAPGIGKLKVADLVAFNHELEVFGWKPQHAIAIAQNSWDLTVHLTGMGEHAQQIVRCERATGRVLERHDHVFEFIAARLYKLDQLQLQ